jgi:hexokinase
MQAKVLDFLNRHNLNPEEINMDKLCEYFIQEMNAGLQGAPSSLPMIPSFCSTEGKPRAGQKVAVIDAGGTNLRTCIVEFSHELKPVIKEFRKTHMPGVDKEVSAKEFVSVFADQIKHIIDQCDKVGFCFSYPAQILPDHDGIPMAMSKEIKAPEIVGIKLGERLFAELASRGHDVSSKKLLILNDTVATLLAAQSENTDNKYDGCIGFILGTGTNTAYIEKSSRIKKLASGVARADAASVDAGAWAVGGLERQIINVESGSLKLSLGDIDEAFLASTQNPNSFNFEKMISGAYLGKLAWYIIKAAIEDGLLSSQFAQLFNNFAPTNNAVSTLDLSTFLEYSDSVDILSSYMEDSSSSGEDAFVLESILKAHIMRAAKLTAVNLASAVLITDFGKDKEHPVLINADGTTFYKTPYLRSSTIEYLQDYLAKKGRYVEFTQIEDSPIIGAAIGALAL